MKNSISILQLKQSSLLRFVGISLLFILLTANPVHSDQATTLCIMNFTNRGTEWNWLSKGLADMLITDLSNCKELQVVEREKMQAFFEEMRLSTTGLIEASTATQFGKIIKANKALFGSFWKKGDEIEIEAHMIDIDTGELLRVEWVKGNVKNLFKLEKELAFKIIKNLHVKLTKAERESICYTPTDSIDATSHFYQGIDSYDHGEYNSALCSFRIASNKDPDFNKAYYWGGEIYRFMDEIKHAVIMYESVLEKPSNQFKGKCLYRLVALYEINLKCYERAIDTYNKIIDVSPEPKSFLNRKDIIVLGFNRDEISIEEWGIYKISTVLEKMGRYEEAMNNYVKLLGQHWKKSHSEYKDLPWLWSLCGHSFYLGCYQRMWVCVAASMEEYGKLINPGDRIIVLTPDNSTYHEDYSTLKRIHHIERACESIDKEKFRDIKSEQNKQGTYIFAAPDGYCIASFRIKMKGRPGKYRGIAVDVNTNFSKDRLERAIGFRGKNLFILSQTCPEVDREIKMPAGTTIFALGLVVGYEKWGNKLDELQIDARLSPLKKKSLSSKFKPAKGSKIYRVIKHEPHKIDNWEVVAEIEIPDTHPDNLQGITMLVDRNDHFWLVWNFKKDLWFSDSENGRKWSEPIVFKMPINTTEDENKFAILEDSFKNYVLSWCSNRSGESKLYISRSRDMKSWSYPVVVDPQHAAWRPSLVQDFNHEYVIFWHAKLDDGNTAFVSAQSKDCRKWTKPAIVSKKISRPQSIITKKGIYKVLGRRFEHYQNSTHGHSVPVMIEGSNTNTWGKPKRIEDLTPERKDFELLSLMINQDSKFAVLWRVWNSTFIAQSSDFSNWSNRTRVPFLGEHVSMTQDRDGVYWLAVYGVNGIKIAKSKNPFEIDK